ncbi:putative exonuclease [Lentisphaera araneosa HTCC2155]|uniref:Putative exonuclease n=1 Tax=Lentisphaera araneosa HTCC2155 TaxID=313628 RepID=A6DRG8_9BACT|nr:3'-5' exonuclease [Lentisphaera araneosa]EDM25778.1 putative exonuclease [Lentisphaera araneosa HTCC2155]
MDFVAIDFETATAKRNSACAVAIITVEKGVIVDEYSELIQPPNNEYSWRNIDVHGIEPRHTMYKEDFEDLYPEIRKRLTGKLVVAHNESFDRSVMTRSMEYYDLDYADLGVADRWVCTVKLYKAQGFKPAKLNILCDHFGIPLKHHDALSDARACAELYKRVQEI